MIAADLAAGVSSHPRLSDSMARGRGIRAFARFALLAVAVALAGCASGPRGADQVAGYADEDVNDPLEGLNRQIFAINSAADALILRPISVLYSEVVFTPVQNIVRSLLNYLTLPLTFINDMLQGEWDRAGDTATRFVINTMVLGLGDLAADFGRPEQHSEDFGQTLAVWGIRDGGPYLVLPFIGPSNIRDAVGFGVDVYTDPVGNVLTTGQSLARAGMAGVDFRVRNGHEIDELERSSIDYYATVRSLYRQKRASDIRNGAPDKLTPGPGIGDTGQPVASLTAHNPEAPLTY